jgi:hypothetical protein
MTHMALMTKGPPWLVVLNMMMMACCPSCEYPWNLKRLWMLLNTSECSAHTPVDQPIAGVLPLLLWIVHSMPFCCVSF